VGILNFLKKKRHVASQTATDLPPPPPTTTTEPLDAAEKTPQTPPQTMPPLPSQEPVAAPVTETTTTQSPSIVPETPMASAAPAVTDDDVPLDLPSLSTQSSTSPPMEKTVPELHIETPETEASQPEVFQPEIKESNSVAEPEKPPSLEQLTQPEAPISPDELPLQTAEKQKAPAVSTEKKTELASSSAHEAPSFTIPDNYADLIPEEVFISKPKYVSFLGNIELLKKQLAQENTTSITAEAYTNILKKGIKQSLAAEDVLSKIEEHILFS
jgi:hypothetical protein